MATYDPTDLEQITEDKLFPGPMRVDTGDEEAIIYLAKKEKAMKAKLVALDIMGKHPLENPSGFSKREKAKLLAIMTEWFEKNEDELSKEFNDVVLDRVLGEKSAYERYSVANNCITFAEAPPNNPYYDLAGNRVEVENTEFPIGVIP